MPRHSFLPATAIFHNIHLVTARQFTIEAVTSYPCPSELTSASTGTGIAWALNEQEKRNMYVAAGPDFSPRQLTAYTQNDGQEITGLSISADSRWVVYCRGGYHSGKAGMPIRPCNG